MARARFDIALAAVLTVATQLECWLGSAPNRPLLSALCLALTVPLGWRRLYPLLVTTLVLSTFAVGQATQGSLTEMATGTLPVLVVVYTVAAYETRKRALVGAAIAVVAVGASVVASPEGATADDFAYAGLIVGVAWGVGRVLSMRHQQLDVLASQNLALERELEQAVREERARIARELHDVVAHGVSVMVLQAGGAAGVVRTRPDDALVALQAIQSTGRGALVELRRMLDLLREDGQDRDDLSPPPGLSDLPALVASMRQAGLETSLSIEAGDVPPAIGLSAYRIVQEGLTNILKHAGAGAAEVAVSNLGSDLVVEVRDNGNGSVATLPGAGRGLAGMRERVSVFGGSLEIEREDGFSLRARLPLSEAS